jgi:hypothetical protein
VQGIRSVGAAEHIRVDGSCGGAVGWPIFPASCIPLVIALRLPVATKTALSGLLDFGLPQLPTEVAIAIVGKSGFHYLMERLFGAEKKLGPPAHVSRRRYRIGLVMLFLPLAALLLEPYVTLLVIQEPLPHWVYDVVDDTLLDAPLLLATNQHRNMAVRQYLLSLAAE